MMKKENSNNINVDNINDADTLSTTTSTASLHSLENLSSLQPTVTLEEKKEHDNNNDNNEKLREDIIEFKCNEINSVETLGSLLLSLFKKETTLSYKNKCIESILINTNFSTNELNRFLFWSSEKPYTRNCVIHNEQFTALLLCWVLLLRLLLLLLLLILLLL